MTLPDVSVSSTAFVSGGGGGEGGGGDGGLREARAVARAGQQLLLDIG